MGMGVWVAMPFRTKNQNQFGKLIPRIKPRGEYDASARLPANFIFSSAVQRAFETTYIVGGE